MTKIYVIRHGETEGNIYARLSGFYDTHLTSRGKMQADALEDRFKDIHIDAVYSSSRVRAVQTAQAAVRGKGLEVKIYPRISECNLGDWDNDNWGHIEYMDYDEVLTYRKMPPKWRARYSEPFEDLKARMTGAVRDLASEHDGQTIIIVSHGHAIRALLCKVLDVPDDKVAELGFGGNTAVSLLNVENGEITAEYVRDYSHLEGKLDKFGEPLYNPSQSKGSGAAVNVYCESMDIDKYADFYISCKKAALGDVDEKAALENIKNKSLANRENILVCKDGDRPVGVVELDTRKDAEHGYGWIEFYYIDEAYRNPHSAMHPFGHVIQYYRTINRVELRWKTKELTEDEIRFLESRDLYIITRDENSVTFGYDLYM